MQPVMGSMVMPRCDLALPTGYGIGRAVSSLIQRLPSTEPQSTSAKSTVRNVAKAAEDPTQSPGPRVSTPET